MKAVTGNRLSDGSVVYLSAKDQWVSQLSHAALFEKSDATNVLRAVQTREGELADVYLIDVSEDGKLQGRDALRESIRQVGPSVRANLGQHIGA